MDILEFKASQKNGRKSGFLNPKKISLKKIVFILKQLKQKLDFLIFWFLKKNQICSGNHNFRSTITIFKNSF